MSMQKLIIFKHDTALGNAPAHELFKRVQIKRKDLSKPARDFSDYEVSIDRNGVPHGISII
jgi:CRISPR-associated protein Csd2